MIKGLIVTLNDAGRRIGQDHPKAKLTDHEVEMIRQLHDEGWGYRRLARVFEVSRTCIAELCRYENRAQIVARFRTVRLTEDDGPTVPDHEG